MKSALTLFLIVAIPFFLAWAIAEMTGFSVLFSSLIAGLASLLFYLMLDRRPEVSPKDTVYRLTRGQWYRKKD